MALSLVRSIGGLLLVMSICGVATGCSDDDSGSDTASDDSSSTIELSDRTLVSTDVSGHDLVEGSTVRISFQDGRMAVVAGCNTMSAAYTHEAGTLMWSSEPAMTMMGCEPDLMEQDQWLSELFTAGVEVSGDGSDVVLTSGDVSITLADE